MRPEHIRVGKLENVGEAIEIERERRTIPGGNGIALGYRVKRHAKNLERVLTCEGARCIS